MKNDNFDILNCCQAVAKAVAMAVAMKTPMNIFIHLLVNCINMWTKYIIQ